MKYCFAFFLLMAFPLSALADSAADEAEYIASIMTKLDKQVIWPKDRPTEGGGKLFVVAVIGKSPVTDRLKKLSGEKTATGKKFKIRVVTADLLPANAHVLVVTPQDDKLLTAVLKKLAGTGTLTVSRGQGFGEMGAMINFYHETVEGKDRLRFEVNLDAVGAEGIEINSELLEDAHVIAQK